MNMFNCGIVIREQSPIKFRISLLSSYGATESDPGQEGIRTEGKVNKSRFGDGKRSRRKKQRTRKWNEARGNKTKPKLWGGLI
jgi:hypothetical protein